MSSPFHSLALRRTAIKDAARREERWPAAILDTGGEFAALPATACGGGAKRSLSDPIQVDQGRFCLEHSSNIEFATSVILDTGGEFRRRARSSHHL